MRILLLGGTGFIGTPLALRLATEGHRVTVYHRGPHAPALPDVITDLRSELAAIPMMRFPPQILSAEFDVVVHLVLLGELDAQAAVDAFAGRAGRLVVVSSGDVYAAYGALIGIEPEVTDPKAPLNEESPLRQTLYPYGRRVPGPWGELWDYDKILAERVVLQASPLSGTILRLPKVYGPGDRQGTFGSVVARMRDARPFILLGEAQAGWRWTHGYVDDVACAIALSATDRRAMGRIYNVGERQAPTWKERLEALAVAGRWPGSVVVVPEEQLPAHLRIPYRLQNDLAFDTERIRTDLGYREPTDEATALRLTYEYHAARGEEHPDSLEAEYLLEDSVRRNL